MEKREQNQNQTHRKPQCFWFFTEQNLQRDKPWHTWILIWDDPSYAITESSSNTDQSHGDFLSHVPCSFPPFPTHHFSLQTPLTAHPPLAARERRFHLPRNGSSLIGDAVAVRCLVQSPCVTGITSLP